MKITQQHREVVGDLRKDVSELTKRLNGKIVFDIQGNRPIDEEVLKCRDRLIRLISALDIMLAAHSVPVVRDARVVLHLSDSHPQGRVYLKKILSGPDTHDLIDRVAQSLSVYQRILDIEDQIRTFNREVKKTPIKNYIFDSTLEWSETLTGA